ncbi:VOC family protein [Blastopirellula marina]|uniref:VOC family protein n=1 Tax=Blastopirellula marina TaxID=124 RepID=A0A2S8GJ12_9BACT|nr:VOC family protein [Blastopirellula marina]PQO44435.1 VOC family protein [Blastopirellula marina]
MTPKIPPGREGFIPHLVCDPCIEAIAFYEKAFGAKELFRLPMDGTDKIMHCEMSINGHSFMMADDFPEYCDGASQTATSLGGTPVTLHRYVPDCDAAIAQAEQAGATVRMPATDMFWGDRYGVVIDPFGHKWSFATPQRSVPPEELTEAMKAMPPGS